MAVIDTANDGQNNTISNDGGRTPNASTMVTTGTTMITGAFPSILPLVVNLGGAAADKTIQDNVIKQKSTEDK